MKVFIMMMIAMSLLAQAVQSCSGDPPPPKNWKLEECTMNCAMGYNPWDEKEEQDQCYDECDEKYL